MIVSSRRVINLRKSHFWVIFPTVWYSRIQHPGPGAKKKPHECYSHTAALITPPPLPPLNVFITRPTAHCPKNNPNLRIKTFSLSQHERMWSYAYFWQFFTYIWPRNHWSYSCCDRLGFYAEIFRLFLGQCCRSNKEMDLTQYCFLVVQ